MSKHNNHHLKNRHDAPQFAKRHTSTWWSKHLGSDCCRQAQTTAGIGQKNRRNRHYEKQFIRNALTQRVNWSRHLTHKKATAKKKAKARASFEGEESIVKVWTREQFWPSWLRRHWLVARKQRWLNHLTEGLFQRVQHRWVLNTAGPCRVGASALTLCQREKPNIIIDLG